MHKYWHNTLKTFECTLGDKISTKYRRYESKFFFCMFGTVALRSIIRNVSDWRATILQQNLHTFGISDRRAFYIYFYLFCFLWGDKISFWVVFLCSQCLHTGSLVGLMKLVLQSTTTYVARIRISLNSNVMSCCKFHIYNGAMFIFYISMIWYGMVFICYGLLFLCYAKNEIICYGMVCYALLCYEIWVNVPSFTKEFHLFCIFKLCFTCFAL